MSITDSFKEGDSSASPLSVFEQSLEAVAVSGKHQKEADFAQAYPTIEQHLACKLSQKLLLSKFNEAYGHTLHPPGFRTLLEAERKRRVEAGHLVTCTSCGQQLPAAYQSAGNVADTEEKNHVQ